MTHAPLTVIVPCFNNEAYIEACLRAVTWADEVLLVDSYSTDSTLEVARPFVTTVVQHEYENSARQKNWAIPQAAHEWVLVVDTDEIVTDELRREIEAALTAPAAYQAFRIPRKNVVFGRWLRRGGYWPDHQVRLLKREAGRYEDRHVHADVAVQGPIGTLTSPYHHYPHRSWQSIRRTLLGRYSAWEAQQKFNEGVEFRWSLLLTRPLGAFLVRNFLRKGCLDGWQGWLMSGVWTAYVFQTYWKLRRLEQNARAGPFNRE